MHIIEPEIFVPHGYQDRAFNFTLENPFAALWMEMGLGKTVVSLTVLDYLLDSFKTKHTLIVAPLRVAKSTWPDEMAKWTHTEHLLNYTSIVTGTAEQRAAAVHTKAPIHIVNYDNLVWMVKYVLEKTGGRWPWDTIIVDESSWVKHQSSMRYKALNHVRPAVERMLQLTGSPAAQGLINLWSQLYLLDRGKRLGNTEKAMRDRWYEPVHMNDYGPTWVLRPGASNEIHKRVADIAMSLRAKDYLDMPDDLLIPVRFDLPEHLTAEYKKLERDMWLEIRGKNITAVNGGALTQKCRQFANGFMYDEDKNAHFLHKLKLDALQEVIDESEGQPIIVGYQYQDDLAQIKKRFPTAVQISDDPQMIHDWNDGKIPILLAHPQSAGHGLNLQKGGHIIVLYGLDWRLELYEQIIARLSRQGQRSWEMNQPVIIYLLMARNTIDELMLKRIEYNAEGQDGLKRAVHWYQQNMRMAA
jgi:SNF2 family DNA or RNA helicase